MYLGIDIGTSAVKLVLIDQDGSVVATQSERLSVSRPQSGWSEQDPDSWWRATDTAMMTMQNTHAELVAKIVAIGLSGQMHGMVALDKSNNVLRPAILWNDTRSAVEAIELDSQVPAFRRISGNAVMPGFTAPKALWMARHEPDLFALIDTILLPKDYVRLCLSGEKISDMSDAAGTLWLDVDKRSWAEELLAACDLSINQMPRLVEGAEQGGTLLTSIASRWGIDGCPVIAGGGGDNAAAAIGLGVVSPGDGFLSLGTSGVVFAVTDMFAPAADSGAHAFCHALPNTWHQMGVILAASDCISWASEVSGLNVDQLILQLEACDPFATEPIFHPYLSGERTPHNNADARAGFFGLSRSHEIGDMTRAILQGVSFAIADAVDVLAKAGGAPSRLVATGGGANNQLWLRYIASITGCEILVPTDADIGAALGAARLAMLAVGNDAASVCQKPAIKYAVLPEEKLAHCLQPARLRSQKLYQMFESTA